MAHAGAGDPRLHPVDQRLLDLEVGEDPCVSRFVVTPQLSRMDRRLYGGTALAVALAASEAATGRDALWTTVQFVASAELGERVDVAIDLVARGRSVDQYQLRATVGDRLVFGAMGANASARPDGLAGVGEVMPQVRAPEDCVVSPASDGLQRGEVGQHLVSEYRDAPPLVSTGNPARLTMWARLRGEEETTPAKLGFVADMVPVVVARACGVLGAGTSLDNTLRFGRLVDSEWVLLELLAHVAEGGYGHGTVHVWSRDGVLLATGSQSSTLFSIESFRQRFA